MFKHRRNREESKFIREQHIIAHSFKISPKEVSDLSKEKIINRSDARLEQERSENRFSNLQVIRYFVAPIPGKYYATLGAMNSKGEVELREVIIVVRRDRGHLLILALFVICVLYAIWE